MPPDSRLENSLKSAEDELTLIKNQIQQTLLDIREHVLESSNPFVVPAFTGPEEGTESPLDSALGADGAADSETATGGEQPGEESEDTEEEQLEESGEPLAEEQEILESEFGAPGDEEIIVDSDEGPGTGGMQFQDLVEEEDDPEEEEEPAEDDLGDPAEGEEAEEEAADTAGAREAEPEPLDLISLAGLVRWVAATLERVGRARTEVVLDAYEQSGRMSPEVKQVARTLCELADEDPYTGIPVRDIVGAMMRLEGVLGNDDGQSNRLLSLIFQDEYESADSLIASLGMS